MAPNSVIKKYTLGVGENTFASPSATNENDARKLQSLIPSLSGALEREHPLIPFTADAAFPSRVGFLWQFNRNDAGVVTFHQFCATATTLYVLTAGLWVVVTTVGTLNGIPVARNINNQMHFSDGVNNWLFDGTNWVREGLQIPSMAPTIAANALSGSVNIASVTRLNGVLTVALAAPIPTMTFGYWVVLAGTTITGGDGISQLATFVDNQHFTLAQPGLPDVTAAAGTCTPLKFTILSNRYYWTTFSDQTPSHAHESSSSPISVGTGVQATATGFTVSLRAGNVAFTAGSTAVVGSATDFNSLDVGLVIINPINQIGYVIASVTDSQHLTLASPSAVGTGSFGNNLIAPARATHWNVYASSSETDKVGNFLASIPLYGAQIASQYIDQSPMIGTIGAYFSDVNRPLLNDPPNSSIMLEVYKNRLWRRDEKFRNFFTYSAYEEVLAEQAGSPYECVPGVAANTVATQINETSYPDQSLQLRGFCTHGDSLYIGSELNIIPLYGSSLQDFSLSPSQAFAVGLMGRKACVSTPFGLAFVSYDMKVYLYPSQYSFGVDSTTALVELGRPKRPEFETIDGADFDNVGLTFYNWGRRNWLVINYRRVDQSFGTWVFDFETKGWMQLQQGYTAIGVFEMTTGRKCLVGAGANRLIYVIDDLSGSFTPAPTANYPVGYYREVIDFGDPNSNFAIKSIGFETSNSQMEVDMTLWLDPKDVDNPGTGITIPMTLTRLGANSLIGRPTSDTGGSCQRALVEFAVAASAVNGTFHGFTVEAEKLPASPTI